MDITTYLSYDEVRAVLGVSTQEITDTQLGLGLFGDELQQELLGVSGILSPDTISRNLIDQYTYLCSLSSPTTNQILLQSYIRTFAVYTVAAALLASLSLSVPKTISDGKALMTRFSPELTFESVRDRVQAKKFDLKRKIQDLLGVVVTERSFISVVAPAIDVVTGVAYE